MDLQPYVESIQRQLVVAAEAGGDDARAVTERLLPPLDAAIRLTLQEALAAAAEAITCELAPGSVELRLRGRDLEFVVTLPLVDTSDDDESEDHPGRAAGVATAGSAEADDGAMSRINLRMADQLKARIEQAASGEGVSVNGWLVRAAASALERTDSRPRRDAYAPHGARRYRGWAR